MVFDVMRYLIKIILAGIVSLGVLSVFAIAYEYTGVHIYNETEATDYKRQPRQLMTNMNEGFSVIIADENGFNNSYDVYPKERVSNLLMGSSHMEAAEVGARKNTGYLLNTLLDGRTYNIGMAGHQIYNCVNNMSSAVNEYNPSDYVILETDRVILEPDKMQQVLVGAFSRLPSYDSGIVYLLQKYVPSIKYLYKQIDVWRHGEQDASFDEIIYDDSYIQLLQKFIEKAAADASKMGAQLMIVYQPATVLDKSGNLVKASEEPIQLFRAACDKSDVVFIDMTDVFCKLYYENHVLAHGFINTAVGEGHLNESGHRVMATAIAQCIEERH